MSDELKVYRVTNKSPLRNGGMFRSGLVFATSPQEAFTRMMDYLNQTKLARVYDQQQFEVRELPILDCLVFEVEVDGGVPELRVNTNPLKTS